MSIPDRATASPTGREAISADGGRLREPTADPLLLANPGQNFEPVNF